MEPYLEKIRLKYNLKFEDTLEKVDQCIGILKKIHITHKYHYKSRDLIEFYNNFILEDYNDFHKLVVLKLINDFNMEGSYLTLPESLYTLYDLEFSRIKNLVKNDSFVFNWQNDYFAKDIAICTHRLIPTGAQYIEISGFSRRYIFGSVENFIKTIKFFFIGRRKLKPYMAIHTHSGNLADFNQEGWERCYVRIGQILKLNPNMLGLIGGSWFYDPVIGFISPKLKYLTHTPCQNGAELFYSCKEGLTSGALARSGTRRKLFEEKGYTPKSYILIWSREDMISYSEINEHLLG